MNMKRIIMFFIAAAACASLSAQTVVTSDTSVNEDMNSIRVAVHGGYAYRIGGLPEGIGQVQKDHLKSLKHGVMYGADVTWFFMPSLGAGLRFSDMRTSNESVAGQDRIDIWFLGPEISYRGISRNKRHNFIATYAMGYAGYKDRTAISSVPVRISGGSLGYLMDMSYDYCLTDKIAIGASLSCMVGSVSKFRYRTSDGNVQTSELGGDARESLMHIGASVGVRFYL